jgi:hypothetical protein
MTGEEFKSLDIEQQVNYINELLQQGDSVDNIRIDLGIGKNYIGNTFKKSGYKLDRNINQYISVAIGATNVAHVNAKPIDKPKKIGNANTEDSNYKALQAQIKGLQNQINMINNRLDNSITTNVESVATSIIHNDIDKYDTTDTTPRNFRIYTDILQDFTKFCASNKQHKVQDIISSAIKGYLDKYNK